MNLLRTKPATGPDEPQTRDETAHALAILTSERQVLTDERAVIDDALADLLAARVLGGTVDSSELVRLTERRDANQSELERLDLTISGMQARLDEMAAAERERQAAELRPRIEELGATGERLIAQFYKEFRQLAATVAEIDANARDFAEVNATWNRVHPNVGHGVDWPRDVWGIDPALRYRARLYPGLYTLAGELEQWFTEPQQKAAARERERQAA